jgi:glycosyltransferase involved in cell wall biosynthesis
MRRRILITTPSFAPSCNGVAAVTSAQAFGFARRGHEVVVATGPTAESAEAEDVSDVRVVRFNVAGRGTRREPHTGDIGSYQAFLRAWDGDAILCHCWQTWSTNLAIPLLKEMPSKAVLVSHGFDAHCRPAAVRFPRGTLTWLDWRPYVKLLPSSLQSFDQLVFLSKRVDRNRFYDQFLAQQLGLRNLSVIPNGTFPSDFVEGAGRFLQRYALKGKKIVLHVANYEVHKNQEMAIRSFARSGCADAALVFIGNEENEYSRHLKRTCERMRAAVAMGEVLFLEKLDRDMICSAYQAAALFLCTSFAEVQPLVVLDAMAAGLPFLSTDVGCVSELPGGWISHSVREMASQIHAFLTSESRGAEIGSMGRRAVQAVYNWTFVLDHYEDLFGRLCASHGRSSVHAEKA